MMTLLLSSLFVLPVCILLSHLTLSHEGQRYQTFRYRMSRRVIAPVVIGRGRHSFLVSGKSTSNFSVDARVAQFLAPSGERIQRLACKFPTRRNREFDSQEQGISTSSGGRRAI